MAPASGVLSKSWLLNTTAMPAAWAASRRAQAVCSPAESSTSSRSAAPVRQTARHSAAYCSAVRGARPPSRAVRMVASSGLPGPIWSRVFNRTVERVSSSSGARASRRSSTRSPVRAAAGSGARSPAMTGTMTRNCPAVTWQGGSSVTPRTVIADIAVPPKTTFFSLYPRRGASARETAAGGGRGTEIFPFLGDPCRQKLQKNRQDCKTFPAVFSV